MAIAKNQTPLRSKILVVALWLAILAAVVGSFLVPRDEQGYYRAAALLVPALFILVGWLFRPR